MMQRLNRGLKTKCEMETTNKYVIAVAKAASALRFHATYEDTTNPAKVELLQIAADLVELENNILLGRIEILDHNSEDQVPKKTK